MTVLSRGARSRRSGRRPGWLLLTTLLVLAIAASSALVFTNRVELLKLAVILALWAAVVAAFVSVIYRRQSDIDQAKARDLKLVYDLQLDREISARREYELTVETQLRRELASELRAQAADEVAALRAELAALRTNLEILFDADLAHRPAIETDRKTVRAYSDWARDSGTTGRVTASRIDADDRVRFEDRTDESPIIDVPEEPHPPEYEWVPPTVYGGSHRRASEPEAAPASRHTWPSEPQGRRQTMEEPHRRWAEQPTRRPAEEPSARPRAEEPPERRPTAEEPPRRRRRAAEEVSEPRPARDAAAEPAPTWQPPSPPEPVEIPKPAASAPQRDPLLPWLPSEPSPEPAPQPSPPKPEPTPSTSSTDWQPAPAEGLWIPAGTPGSNWVAPAAENGSSAEYVGKRRAQEPADEDAPARPVMSTPPPEPPRGKHSAPPEAGDPGRPSRPTLATPPSQPAEEPAPRRHRSADEPPPENGQHADGLSAAELLARFHAAPTGGGRRRRREE